MELINKIEILEKEVLDYILNTEHWLFYWIANKEVQDFIKEYPEDYEDRVHLSIYSLSPNSPHVIINFDDHPNDVEYIQRYAVLYTFRDAVKVRWSEWKGKVKELQIKEKKKELTYYKKKVGETEKEILELKKGITMTRGELLEYLTKVAIIFREKPDFISVNKHLTGIDENNMPNKEQIDGILVAFINYVGISQCIDYALSYEDFDAEE